MALLDDLLSDDGARLTKRGEVPRVSHLDEAVQLFPCQLSFTYGPWIAGGAPRRAFENLDAHDADVDVFFRSRGQFDNAMAALIARGADKGLETDYSTFAKYKHIKFNLVHYRFYETAQAVVDNFDMLFCQFLTDGIDIYATESAIDGSAKKYIAFNLKAKHDSVPAILRRVVKYVKQGFSCNDFAFGALLDHYKFTPELTNVRLGLTSE